MRQGTAGAAAFWCVRRCMRDDALSWMATDVNVPTGGSGRGRECVCVCICIALRTLHETERTRGGETRGERGGGVAGKHIASHA